ncbi:MAG: acyl-CoA dehydrogenase family protein [Thermodesulfobacteriota bacterium]
MEWNLPYLTDEHKSLIMLMKEFCEREVNVKALNELADKPIPRNANWEYLRAQIPWDLLSKAHDAGLRQLTVPTAYGGGGYGSDLIALGACAETAGYYGGQMGRIFTIMWKPLADLEHFPTHLQEEVYPIFMEDRKTLLAASITEPNSGSDMLIPNDEPGAAGMYFARREGDEWILNGDKQWCEGAGIANYVILNVRTDPKGPLTKSITSFLFPTSTPGWSVRVNNMMGNEIFLNAQQHYENCRISDRYRITPVNGGYDAMRVRFAGVTIHLFAMLGWAEKTWENIRDYAKARIQGGKPIIQHNNVGMMIAEADVMLRAFKLLLYQNAHECMAEGQNASPLGTFYLNYYEKTMINRLVEIGLDVYGGMGPQKELDLEHWIRVHLSLSHGGSTGTLNLVKASKLLAK